jgi:hypothetical protein
MIQRRPLDDVRNPSWSRTHFNGRGVLPLAVSGLLGSECKGIDQEGEAVNQASSPHPAPNILGILDLLVQMSIRCELEAANPLE